MNEIKKILTVRPNVSATGVQPKSFKVYQDNPFKAPRFFRGDEGYTSEGEAVNITLKAQLYDYQKEAIQAFKGNGVLCLGCGFGKTTVGIAIAAKLKRKTLIIVHKEFLADQWTERIQQFAPGSSIGRIQGDTWNIDGHQFVIAMIQTLCSREFPKDAFDSFGFLIVDEAHHIGAPAFSRVMFLMTPKYTLGLSATPERKDGLTRILFWFLGPIFYQKLHKPDQDSLSVHKIDFAWNGPITINKLGKVCMATMVTQLTEIPERNTLILETIRNCMNRDRNILVLSDRREHCKFLVDNIPGSTLYIGGMPPIPDYNGNVLISTFSLAYEGLDIPQLDTLILTTPHSDVVQAMGRIMRRAGTKEIWDIVDHWSIFESMWYKRNATYKGPKEKKCLFT
jgi:superfamily II DNA or RNA helicase